MSRSLLRRIGTLTTIVALGAFGLTPADPAAADATTTALTLADTGAVSGVLTDRRGEPVGAADVWASGPAGYGNATTEPDGSYTIDALTPGAYTLAFSVNNIEQFAPGKTELADAQIFTVTAGATLTVNEVLLPSGVMTGHVTDAAGNPAQVSVDLLQPDGSSVRGHGWTDWEGNYRLSHVAPGSYKVSFQTTSGAQQYAHHTRSLAAAQTFTVVDGETTTVDDNLLPTGSITGRLTNPAGSGVADVAVAVHGAGGVDTTGTVTGADGTYTVDGIFADSGYKVQFFEQTGKFAQWAHGKLDEADADTFTVTAGDSTVVDETLIATGSVKVTAKNAVTGAAIGSFWARVHTSAGDTITGSLVLTDVPIGTRQVAVDADGYAAKETTVTVTAGAQAAVTVSLTPVAALKVKVVDRVTGAPVDDVGVAPMRKLRANMPGGLQKTQSDGVMTIEVTPGTYQLFVWPRTDGPHGAQWLGAFGGTGSQARAQSFTVAAGQHVTVPTIRLDKKGAVSGKVVSEAALPILGGKVHVLPDSPHGGGGGEEVAADGAYTVDNLGPYTWELFFRADNHAGQWSNGTADRSGFSSITLPRRTTTGTTSGGIGTITRTAVTTATVTTADALPRRTPTPGIKVTSGATAVFNYTMKVGRKVTVSLAGTPIEFVDAYSAKTGDVLNSSDPTNPDGTVTILVLAGAQVKFRVLNSPSFWCGGADFASAAVYTVSTAPTETVTCVKS